MDAHSDNYIPDEDLQARYIITLLTDKYIHSFSVHNNELLLFIFGLSTIIIIGIIIIILSIAG